MHIDRSQYSRIVVLTGAGISAGSGLQTYRGPDGVWEQHDVEKYGHIDALANRPEETWRLFGGMREPVLAAKPNAAHRALAIWEAELAQHQEFLIVTQNIDTLHQRAGSNNVIELHGNVMVTKCSNSSCSLEPYRDEKSHSDKVPTCPLCGSVLRPDVVLFGEQLPALPSWTVKRALRECDLFIAIGTSGLVTPAANYVRNAEYAGARTILVNLEPMIRPNPAFKEQYFGPAEKVLPELLATTDAYS
jgi:NAD-dependent deacetylase